MRPSVRPVSRGVETAPLAARVQLSGGTILCRMTETDFGTGIVDVVLKLRHHFSSWNEYNCFPR
jgi:hypothetical protein